jgi:hypothetical protein
MELTMSKLEALSDDFLARWITACERFLAREGLRPMAYETQGNVLSLLKAEHTRRQTI